MLSLSPEIKPSPETKPLPETSLSNEESSQIDSSIELSTMSPSLDLFSQTPELLWSTVTSVMIPPHHGTISTSHDRSRSNDDLLVSIKSSSQMLTDSLHGSLLDPSSDESLKLIQYGYLKVDPMHVSLLQTSHEFLLLQQQLSPPIPHNWQPLPLSSLKSPMMPQQKLVLEHHERGV